MPGTKLNKKEEVQYNSWKSKLPNNLQYEEDYDLKGLWKENPNQKPSENLHFPDTYKLSNHPTFSNQSIYHSKETPGGYWKQGNFGYIFMPSEHNISNIGGINNLQQYFNNVEPDAQLFNLQPKENLQLQYKAGGYMKKKPLSKKKQLDVPPLDLPKYDFGGDLLQFGANGLQSYGNAAATMLSGGKQVTPFGKPLGAGKDFFKGVESATAPITSAMGAALPMAANVLLPGSGIAVNAAQGVIGGALGANNPNGAPNTSTGEVFQGMGNGLGNAAGSMLSNPQNLSALAGMLAKGGYLHAGACACGGKMPMHAYGGNIATNNVGNVNLDNSIIGAPLLQNSIKQYADGGLVEFKNGGTHEENSNGGIPLGNRGLVEQGETKAPLSDGDFIFSHRLSPKKNGASFADLSKRIKSKYTERDNDAASKKAMMQKLEALAQQQEEYKESKKIKLQEGLGDLEVSQKGDMQLSKGGVLKYMNGGPITMSANGGKLPMYVNGGPFDDLSSDSQAAFMKHVSNTGDGSFMSNDEAWAKAGNDFMMNNPNVSMNSTPFDTGNPNYIADPRLPAQATSASAVPSPFLAGPMVTTSKYVGEQGPMAGLQGGDPMMYYNESKNNNYVGDGSTPTYKPPYNPPIANSKHAGINLPEQPYQDKDLSPLGSAMATAGDAYSLAYNSKPKAPISFDAVNPNLINLERLRTNAYRDSANSAAINRDAVRRLGTSSGQVLSSTIAGNAEGRNKLADVLANSYQTEDIQNASTKNQYAQYNNDLANQGKLLTLEQENQRAANVMKALHGIGEEGKQYITDKNATRADQKFNKQAISSMNDLTPDLIQKLGPDGLYKLITSFKQ
jgi:hypothetical protein